VTASHSVLPDLEVLDAAGLKALVLSQHQQLLSHRSEIEHLKLLIAKLRRMQFGRKSEKLERQIEQLELKLEELESAKVCRASESSRELVPSAASNSIAPTKPARQALPEHLPREVKTYTPKEEACAECGGRLRLLGEDVSEVLEWVPGSFKVMRHVRPKLSCSGCERIVQAPAPSRPI
jgi:transposase